MSDEEMEKLVRRAAVIVNAAFRGRVPLTTAEAFGSPLVAAVFSALVSEQTPAWK